MSEIAHHLYAIYLEGFILASLSDNQLMLYNELDSHGKIFPIKNKWTKDIFKEIIQPQNGYSTIFNATLESLPDDFINIVKFIHTNFWGDIITVKGHRKPFIFAPTTNIDATAPIQLKDLRSVTFALNSYAPKYADTYKIQHQIPYVYEDLSDSELDATYIASIVNELPQQCLIRIIGGDIRSYSQLSELIDILYLHPNHIVYHTTPLTLPSFIHHIGVLSNAHGWNDSYNCPHYIGVVSNEEDFNYFSQLKGNPKIHYVPFFNGKNKQFFISEIATSKDELLNQRINRHLFLLNSIINKSIWGNLYVTPQGEILDSSTKHAISIGNVHHMSLKESLQNIKTNSTWLETRSKRCGECVLCNICPPVSLYEFIDTDLHPCI